MIRFLSPFFRSKPTSKPKEDEQEQEQEQEQEDEEEGRISVLDTKAGMGRDWA